MKEAERFFSFLGKGLPVFLRGLKEAECAHDVGLDEGLGPVDGSVHVAFCCEVKDPVGLVLAEYFIQKFCVADVAVDERVAGVILHVSERVGITRIGKLVEIDHRVP